MKNDIRNAMRHLTLFFMLFSSALWSVSGQSPTGVLKIFSDNPLVVYVDETHYPQYGEIMLVPGTHWVKAINGEGARVHSQIVAVKAGEVTSILIEASHNQSAQSSSGPLQSAQSSSGPSQSAQSSSGPSQSTQAQPSGTSGGV